MVGPSHVVVALASAVAVSRTFGVVPAQPSVLCLIIGALLPDIDGGGSIAKPGTMLRAVLPRGIAHLLDAIGQGVSRAIQGCFGHRGFFHWPMLAVLIIICGVSLGMPPLAWLGFGYLTHTLADAMTHQGVPLLAPFDRKERGLGLFGTGTIGEMICVLLLGAYAVYFGFALLPPGYQQGLADLRAYLDKVHGR